MRKWLWILLLVVCPILLIGCATIISGRTQKVSVTTTPSDAVITVNNMVQKSPAIFTLDRTFPAYQVKIEKEGYRTIELTLKRGINGWVFGNIVFGGIIGLVIDICDGSVYKFSPSEIEQSLVPEGKDGVVLKVK